MSIYQKVPELLGLTQSHPMTANDFSVRSKMIKMKKFVDLEVSSMQVLRLTFSRLPELSELNYTNMKKEPIMKGKKSVSLLLLKNVSLNVTEIRKHCHCDHCCPPRTQCLVLLVYPVFYMQISGRLRDCAEVLGPWGDCVGERLLNPSVYIRQY